MARNLEVSITEGSPYYFVSYNSEDSSRIVPIVKGLEESNLPMWYDNGISTGEDWKTTISKKIDCCELIIMFISKTIFLKEHSYVYDEYDLATRFSQKQILPVYLDKINDFDVPTQYRLWWVDLSRLQGIEAFSLDTETICSEILSATNHKAESTNNFNNDKSDIDDFFFVKQKTVEDPNATPIEALNLSVRASRSLHSEGITKINELFDMPEEAIAKFKNMGSKSAKEVFDEVNEFINNNTDLVITYNTFRLPNVTIDVLPLSTFTKNILSRNNVTSVSEIFDINVRELVDRYGISDRTAVSIRECLDDYFENSCEISSDYDIKSTIKEKEAIILKTDIKNKIIQLLQSSLMEGIPYHKLLEYFSADYSSVVLDVLSQLCDDNVVINYHGVYELKRAMFRDVVFNYLNGNELQIVSFRMEHTLEEAGASIGVTRERARQIEAKAFKKIKNLNIPIAEDKYAYLYQTYNFDESSFIEAFNESAATYYFLSKIYKAGKQKIDCVLDDENVPVPLKRKVEKFIYNDCVFVGDSYIKKDRASIEEYVLVKYCQNEVTYDKFYELTINLIKAYGLEKEISFSDNDKRSRWNRLSESKLILCKNKNKTSFLRYYNIESNNYEDLLKYLHLEMYRNIELSALKLFRDTKDVMRQYDIRDEYELHNLLRKIEIQKMYPEIELSKSPTIKFGVFNRREAMIHMLKELSPISSDELAKAINEVYGIKENTALSVWADEVKEYNHGGVFSVNNSELPCLESQMLLQALTEDFYTIDEIRDIYLSVIPNADKSMITAFSLKLLGFQVNKSGYAYRNHSNIESCIANEFLKNDIIDSEKLYNRFSKASTYYVVMTNLRQSLDIVEIKENNYASINFLNKFGITKSDLVEYKEKVIECIEDGAFFNYHLLSNQGYDFKKYVNGYETDYMINSVLSTDDRLSSQKLGGTTVLFKGDAVVSIASLIDSIVKTKLSVLEIQDLLEEQFGVVLDQYKIVEKISSSTLYYDRVTKTIYKNYNLFNFSEVK